MHRPGSGVPKAGTERPSPFETLAPLPGPVTHSAPSARHMPQKPPHENAQRRQAASWRVPRKWVRVSGIGVDKQQSRRTWCDTPSKASTMKNTALCPALGPFALTSSPPSPSTTRPAWDRYQQDLREFQTSYSEVFSMLGRMLLQYLRATSPVPPFVRFHAGLADFETVLEAFSTLSVADVA
eukprot:3905397-Rhodomonas_salina.4